MSVPWPAIISALPTLVDAATRLFKRTQKPPVPAIPDSGSEDRLKAVIDRLEYFEKLETEQAQVVKQLAEQLQNMGAATAAASKRAHAALATAVVASIVALASLLI